MFASIDWEKSVSSKTFEEIYSAKPAVFATAPGRVNLLGEHTDYNDGYVLPTAIPQQTTVALKINDLDEFRVYAADLDAHARFALNQAPAEVFAQYLYGCIRVLREQGVMVPSLDIYVASNVPMGVGLSSSAALEVAMLRALRALLGLDIDDVAIARFAQKAEIEYAHVRVGIMDQMASSLADSNHMLFLDTRTLERRLLPLPHGGELLVIDSGLSRSLAGSAYNTRREECEVAARRLGVRALRDVTDVYKVEALAEPYRRRARHVVSENERVLRAVKGVTLKEFGSLMNASHASLRDDFEVSAPALDMLVNLLQAHSNVFGARLTGAGFGGACVALCQRGGAVEIGCAVLEDYHAAGQHGRILIPQLSDRLVKGH